MLALGFGTAFMAVMAAAPAPDGPARDRGSDAVVVVASSETPRRGRARFVHDGVGWRPWRRTFSCRRGRGRRRSYRRVCRRRRRCSR